MLKDNYEVEIIINGKPAKEYFHKGNVYMEGREGTRFSIRVRNNSGSRKLFVPTIDGLSVMDGEEADFGSSGYIVSGYDTLRIDGWRKSDKDVAEFFFSSPEKSYRKRMKKGNNIGVIGVAVFSEVMPQVTFAGGSQTVTIPWSTSSWTGQKPFPDNNIFPTAYSTCLNTNQGILSTATSLLSCSMKGSSNKPVSQELGTGWGDTRKSEVVTVSFDRKSDPDSVFEIFYNTRQQLEKMGVDFGREPIYVTPQAFPGRYCKPPKN